MKKVLVACEYSGVVRKAFAKRGWEAVSCDLLATEQPCGKNEYHFQGNVFDLLKFVNFDLMIAHPPCTRLASSGARWWAQYPDEQRRAILFFMRLALVDIPHIAIENPVGKMSSVYRQPDQYVQPWEFGHGETKKTGLWLKNLPPLTATKIVSGREQRVHYLPPSPDRWKERSRTYTGIAEAMADQWGSYLTSTN